MWLEYFVVFVTSSTVIIEYLKSFAINAVGRNLLLYWRAFSSHSPLNEFYYVQLLHLQTTLSSPVYKVITLYQTLPLISAKQFKKEKLTWFR